MPEIPLQWHEVVRVVDQIGPSKAAQLLRRLGRAGTEPDDGCWLANVPVSCSWHMTGALCTLVPPLTTAVAY